MGISGINLTLLGAGDHYDPAHHVQDAYALELPFGIHIPLDWVNVPGYFTLSKFMLLQLVAFGLTLWIFRGLAQRAASGQPLRGRWWNFWESMVLFIRDEVVRPTIGDEHHDDHGHDEHHGDEHGEAGHAHHDGHGHGELHVTPGGAIAVDVTHPADKYLPFVLSCFFYVLFCNLLGAFPFLGSATGDINVTGALAIVVFLFVMFYGSRELGFVGFWTNLVPSMELPIVLKILLIPPIWAIELLGLVIKHGVLAVRLFANIMAGHTVLAVVLGFIFNAANSPEAWLWWAVTPASILGQVAIGMLELFVAFLQAYVFAFLATLFIGAAVHQH